DLMTKEARSKLLRDEVNLLQKKLKTAETQKTTFEKSIKELTEKSTQWQDRASELQSTVERLQKLYDEKASGQEQQEVKELVDDAMKPIYIDIENEGTGESSETLSNAGTLSRKSLPQPPPLPPMVPGLPPPTPMWNTTKIITPNVNLPMLNWTPIYHPGNTVFKKHTDDEILKEVNFADFENEFQLPDLNTTSKAKRDQVLKRNSGKITFVENDRARNLLITRRNIEFPLEKIAEYLDQCDIEKIPGDYAELLLKYVPTQEERKALARHSKEYAKFGEAELYMHEMNKIERLESKLGVMAFMGMFEELITTVAPQIEAVMVGSASVYKSAKLVKIFQIILAFGNYMNSSKRGYASGFKLESLPKLMEVRSPQDRSVTVLHHIAQLIENQYPELMTTDQELILHVGKGVSYQVMTQDIHGLRKGLDMVRTEIDKQEQNNPILQKFYDNATEPVRRVGEGFRKMEEAYREVCVKYGENCKQIEPDEFFQYFTTLLSNLKKCQEENQNRDSLPELSPRPLVSPVRRTNSLRTHEQQPRVTKENLSQAIANLKQTPQNKHTKQRLLSPVKRQSSKKEEKPPVIVAKEQTVTE
ncbi:unnamed protein product, partial [Owenia fusiformis]